MSRTYPDSKRPQPPAYGFEHDQREINATLLHITEQLQQLCSQFPARSLQGEQVRTEVLSALDAWFNQAVPMHRDNPRTPYELAAAIAYHTLSAKVKRAGMGQSNSSTEKFWHGSDRAEKDIHLVQAQQILTSFMLQETQPDVRAAINLWYGALFELPWGHLSSRNINRIRKLQWRDKDEELKVWTACSGVAAQVAFFTAMQHVLGRDEFHKRVSYSHPYIDVVGKIDVFVSTTGGSDQPNIGIQLKSNARLPAGEQIRFNLYFQESDVLEAGAEGDKLRSALRALKNKNGVVIKLELRMFPQHDPAIEHSAGNVIHSRQAVFDGLTGIPSELLVKELEKLWHQVVQQLNGR